MLSMKLMIGHVKTLARFVQKKKGWHSLAKASMKQE